MASFSAMSVLTVNSAPILLYAPTTAPTPYQEISVQAIPDTDYGFLAGVAGAQIAAAMGSEYEPPTITPSPSGSFNTKQVVGIIGQQIAAALNQ